MVPDFQLMFAAVTPAVMIGAFAERLRFLSFGILPGAKTALAGAVSASAQEVTTAG